MKKLMTIAAAALCTTVFGAIESTNVVGYHNKTTVANGFNGFIQTFNKIDGSDFKLSDIDGTFTGEDMVQVIGIDGDLVAVFTYYAGFGWADDDANPMNDYVIPAGNSVTLYTQNAVKITQSGTVSKVAKEVSIGAGFTSTGNPFPCDTTLGAIQFTGLATEDTLQIIGTDGNLSAVYTYYAGFGWADDDGNPVGDLTVKAGDTFYIGCAAGNAKMVIPSPL